MTFSPFCSSMLFVLPLFAARKKKKGRGRLRAECIIWCVSSLSLSLRANRKDASSSVDMGAGKRVSGARRARLVTLLQKK